MGITDAVLLILLEQFAVAAVEAGCKIKVVELSAERFIFPAVPEIRQGLLLDIANSAMGDLPADIVKNWGFLYKFCVYSN